jgi:hypothetical protein
VCFLVVLVAVKNGDGGVARLGRLVADMVVSSVGA